MRTFDESLAQVRDVDGWMSPDQAERLYRAAAATRPGDQIVEIGSFQGRSTIVLASAAPAEVPVVAIDPHAGNDRGPQELDGFEAEAAGDHEVFNGNLAAAGVSDHVRHVRMFSNEAHGEVDGRHRRAVHRRRPSLSRRRAPTSCEWGARVAPGGTMLIHDSFSSVGVTLAIARELMCGRGSDTSVAPGRSPSSAPTSTARGRAALLNGLRLAAQLPWFVKNLLVKVLITVKLGGLLKAITGRDPEWPY